MQIKVFHNVWQQVWQFLTDRKPSRKEIALLYQQFAVLLKSGVPFRAVMRTVRGTSSESLNKILFRINKEVENGNTFTNAMAKFPDIFPNLDVGVARMGEATGALDDAMQRLADYHEQAERMKLRIQSILIYPIFILTTTFIMTIIIFMHFLPNFQKIYTEMNLEIPLITKVILATITLFSTPAGIAMTVLFLIASIYNVRTFLLTPEGTEIKDNFLLHCPGVRRVIKTVQVIEFLRSFTALIESGMPLVKILSLQKTVVANVILRRHLEKVLDELIEGRAGIQDIVDHPMLPAELKQIFMTIQNTGQYSGILSRVTAMYEIDLNATMEQLMQLISPILLTIIGVIVGITLISIFLPIYSLMSEFSR